MSIKILNMGQALNIQLKESIIDVDGLYAEEIQLIKKLIGLLKHQKHNSYNRVVEEERERMGWLALAEKNLADIWDNPIDEKIWSQYL